MDLSKVPLDVQTLLQDAMLSGEGRPTYKYTEGVKGDIEGTAYPILVPVLDYDKLTIKVMGEITPSVNYPGSPTKVEFTGVTARLYRNFKRGGEVELSMTAESITEKTRMRLKKEGEE